MWPHRGVDESIRGVRGLSSEVGAHCQCGANGARKEIAGNVDNFGEALLLDLGDGWIGGPARIDRFAGERGNEVGRLLKLLDVDVIRGQAVLLHDQVHVKLRLERGHSDRSADQVFG